jgi:glycosyltransferase involved in cell wall biosynthesis
VRVSLPRPATGTAGVTAVIPCFNYGHYLPQAVASVLDQPGVDARVIVVDDRSTDDSLAVARALAAADPRITVIAHQENRGHIATYNDGLAAVDTEYVTLLSADDLVAPGALGRATALMAAHPRVGMVYGQPVEFVGSPPPGDRDGRAPYTWTRWRGRAWTAVAARRGRCFILSPEVVMRTAVVREIGGYNPLLPKSGDLEYWLRTANRWDVGRVNGRVQAFYRQHEANMHATILPSMADDYRHRLLAFRYLSGTDSAHLVDRARRALAREALGVALRDLDAAAPASTAPASGAAASADENRHAENRHVENTHAETARELRGAAVEIWPAAASGRRARVLDSRLRDSGLRRRPARGHRLRSAARNLADRARWRFWVLTGVS